MNNKIEDLVMNGVIAIVNDNNARIWAGTMTQLSSALSKVLGRRQAQKLPGSPAALRLVINKVVNRLRNRRISVKFARTTDHARTRYVRFSR